MWFYFGSVPQSFYEREETYERVESTTIYNLPDRYEVVFEIRYWWQFRSSFYFFYKISGKGPQWQNFSGRWVSRPGSWRIEKWQGVRQVKDFSGSKLVLKKGTSFSLVTFFKLGQLVFYGKIFKSKIIEWDSGKIG